MTSLFESPAQAPAPRPFNMAAYVLAQAEKDPGKTALAVLSPSRARRMRYGDLAGAVAGIAGALQARGLQPGARILLRLGNSTACPLAYLGAIWAGYVPVPTAAGLTEAEITAMAHLLDPALVLASPGLSLPRDCAAPVLREEEIAEMQDHTPVPADLGDPERPAYIVFTSGTSGNSRAVVHAHRAVWARRMMWEGWYGLTQEDRMMHAGAFNWTYTMGTGLMDPWAIGATALIPAPDLTTAQLPLLMARHQATIFAAAPGVYRQMLKNPLPALPDLRHGLSAGEALSPIIAARWQEATGTDLHEALGMSECSTFISASPSHPAAPGSCGRPQQGRRIAVLGEDGTPVAHDTPGTLAIHRSDPGLMLGYLDDEQATAERFQGDWFLTGDTVALAASGDVTYLGRSDDMLNAGGFRVSPVEVEAAATSHPALDAAAAVEHRVKADATVIALHYTTHAPVTEDDLHAHLAQRLAPFKRPRLLIRAEQLPTNRNGKIDRKALRN